MKFSVSLANKNYFIIPHGGFRCDGLTSQVNFLVLLIKYMSTLSLLLGDRFTDSKTTYYSASFEVFAVV
jgi:hypothetical protein